MKRLEVGQVYRSKNRFLLAVGKQSLVTVLRRKVVEIQSGNGIRIARHVSVGELCSLWEITLEDLDEITDLYLQPREHVDPDKRRFREDPRQDTEEEIAEFIVLRTFRFSR